MKTAGEKAGQREITQVLGDGGTIGDGKLDAREIGGGGELVMVGEVRDGKEMGRMADSGETSGMVES